MRRRQSSIVGEARAAAAALSVPVPFKVRDVLLDVERRRGRPIVLHPVEPSWAGASGWCGAWLPTADRDHIVFVRDPKSTVRNAGTILHEVGHMMLNHGGELLPAGVDLDGLGLAGLERARGRSGFDHPEEQAAEVFASVLLERGLGTANQQPIDAHAALLKSRLG